MEFDKSKVYTVLTADEVKVGSKGYFADNLTDLEAFVAAEDEHCFNEIHHIASPDNAYRFSFKDIVGNYALFYLVEEPEPAPKEVTASEWDNRPRLMKVWDDDFEPKESKVIYIASEENLQYPVVVLSSEGGTPHIAWYEHCAEIAATKEVEKEKSYRPYKNTDELIADYKKRFCPDCKGIPAVWVKNVADTLKQVVAITDNGIRVLSNINLIDYSSLLDTFTYPDGSPCGMEE